MRGPYPTVMSGNASKLKRGEHYESERDTLLQRNDVCKHGYALEAAGVVYEDDPRSLAEPRRVVTVRRTGHETSYGVPSGWGQ